MKLPARLCLLINYKNNEIIFRIKIYAAGDRIKSAKNLKLLIYNNLNYFQI